MFLLILGLAGPATELQAQVDCYHTVLHLTAPVANVSAVDRVEFEWCTTLFFGRVSVFDLTDLSMRLWAGHEPIYADQVILDSTVLPFAGQARPIPEDDYFWDFNLATMGLQQMVNAATHIAATTAGTQFVVNDSVSIPDDSIVDIRRYEDGVSIDSPSEILASQHTSLVLFGDGFESGDTSAWN